jgi:hypothetical protein
MKIKRKPLVYIASPYTTGTTNRNVRAHLDTFDRLLVDDVVTPVAPLMATLADLIHPRSYQTWMKYDFEMIARCDALYHMDAVLGDYVMTTSEGRDMEVEHAIKIGIPTFDSLTELYRWTLEWNQEPIIS